MKELLVLYAEYNASANKRITDALLKLEEGKVDEAIVSSFPSVRATVLHMWAAEYIWLQRLQLAESPVWVAGDFAGTFAEACHNWMQVSGLAQFTARQYDDKAFTHTLQFYDRAKASHKMPVYQVLMQVLNHATYHRGQLVTMMRQLGAKEIPGTDFLGFVRKK